MEKKVMFFVPLLLLFCVPAKTAQADRLDKVPVEIISKSPDAVGEILVDQLRELFRSSVSYRLTSSMGPKITIRISTMDKFKSSRPLSETTTVFCIIWTTNAIGGLSEYSGFIDYTIGYCGRQYTKEAAYKLFERTVALVNNMKDEGVTFHINPDTTKIEK